MLIELVHRGGLILKKVTIVVSLAEECSDVANFDIEKEIKRELSENLSLIPWAKKIESVSVE